MALFDVFLARVWVWDMVKMSWNSKEKRDFFIDDMNTIKDFKTLHKWILNIEHNMSKKLAVGELLDKNDIWKLYLFNWLLKFKASQNENSFTFSRGFPDHFEAWDWAPDWFSTHHYAYFSHARTELFQPGRKKALSYKMGVVI